MYLAHPWYYMVFYKMAPYSYPLKLFNLQYKITSRNPIMLILFIQK